MDRTDDRVMPREQACQSRRVNFIAVNGGNAGQRGDPVRIARDGGDGVAAVRQFLLVARAAFPDAPFRAIFAMTSALREGRQYA